MASNAKWRERLIEALKVGDLAFWKSNNGYLGTQEIKDLEDLYLPKSKPAAAPKAAKAAKATKASKTKKSSE